MITVSTVVMKLFIYKCYAAKKEMETVMFIVVGNITQKYVYSQISVKSNSEKKNTI